MEAERGAFLPTNLAVSGIVVSGLWFADQHRGWAAGAVDQQSAIWHTRDGGKKWERQHMWARACTDSLGAVLDVRFVDDRYGWAVGFNGTAAFIAATEDGGLRWKVQYSGSEITGQFSRISCIDRRDIWVLSSDGVMQTRDGGQTWKLRYFDSALLANIDALEPSKVWVAGAWGHLLHSRNEVAWRQVPLTPMEGHFFGYVRFIDTDRGWASGTHCDIVSTKDAGQTWAVEACPLRPELVDEVTTGEMARSPSKLFLIANPGRILVRSIE